MANVNVRKWGVFVLGLFLWLAPHGKADPSVRIINGKPVDAGTYKDVFEILSNGSGCTATAVGPRTIITAAHCANTGATATFTIDGTQYTAKMTRSNLYPGKDHDISVGVTTQDIKVDPSTIGGKADVGGSINLLGFGCTAVGGGGGNDKILRIGDTVITGFSDYDMVSRKANGAALCFGDSGGPAFAQDASGKRRLLGINSKGNIKDTNYNARLDIPESQTFLTSFAQTNNVTICGINSDCSTGPAPTPPTCSMSPNPPSIKLGQSVTVTILSAGQVTDAQIEGTSVSFPSGSRMFTPSTKGQQTVNGSVKGPGGTGVCSTTYLVEDNIIPPTGPTCTISATPNSVKTGETVTLEMNTQGTVTSASIDGTSVSFPLGKKMVSQDTKGTYSVTGSVAGPGGSSNCYTSYLVDDGSIDPNTPNLAIVPSYCGDNTLLQTQVRKVCLGVVKKDAALADLKITEAIIVNYADGSREVMPLISRKPRNKSPGDLKIQEDLTLYANMAVDAGGYSVLDSRQAILTKLPLKRGEYPSGIEGRSAKGQYFIVEHLNPYGVSK